MTDKKRFIFNCLLSLILGIVIGVGDFGIKGNKSTEIVTNNSNDFTDSDEFDFTSEDGNYIKLFVGNIVEKSSDIDTYATSKSYTVKATLLPEGAPAETLEWSLAFENPNSEWATGKTVTDYVNISSVSADTLTVKVIGKAAFGERIILKACFSSCKSISTSVKIEYQRKVLVYKFAVTSANNALQFVWTYGSSLSAANIKTGTTVTIRISTSLTGTPKCLFSLPSFASSPYTTEAASYEITRVVMTPTNDFKGYLVAGLAASSQQKILQAIKTYNFTLTTSQTQVEIPFAGEWFLSLSKAGVSKNQLQTAVTKLDTAGKPAYTVYLYCGTNVVCTAPLYFNTTISS